MKGGILSGDSPFHPHADVASDRYDDLPVADMHLFANSNFALCPHDTCDYQIASAILFDYNMNGTIFCELNNTASVCNMVREGLCLSIIPGYCIPRDMGLLAICFRKNPSPDDFLNYQGLSWLFPQKPFFRYVQLIYHKDHSISPAEASLFQEIQEIYDQDGMERIMEELYGGRCQE